MNLLKNKVFSIMLTLSLGTVFFSCKKTELVKVNDKEVSEIYKQTVQIPSTSKDEGYLNMEISSSNSEYLEVLIKYYSNLKVNFTNNTHENSTPQRIEDNSIFNDTIGYSVHLDWSNFSFDSSEDEKHLKLMTFVDNQQQKWFYESAAFTGVSAITSSAGFSFTQIYNTTKYFDLGCFCYRYKAYWKISRDLAENNVYYNNYTDGFALTSIITVDCLNSGNHVRLHPIYSSFPFGCPYSSGYAYRKNNGDVYGSGIVNNEIRSIRGRADDITKTATANINIYFWM